MNKGTSQTGEILKPKKRNFKKYAVLAISVCLLMVLSLLMLLFLVKDLWKQVPEKVYDVEYKFFNDGQKTTVLMEIDPRNKIETFRMENGTDNAVEIHDFKHGFTGIYFAGLEKCFIKTQRKEIPTVEETELELEEGEITTTIYEQSMFWVASENPIEDKDFLKSSRILELCHNKSLHWIFPAFPSAPEFQDFDDDEDDALVAEQKFVLPKGQRGEKRSGKRQSRSLTEEDLPVNDYRYPRCTPRGQGLCVNPLFGRVRRPPFHQDSFLVNGSSTPISGTCGIWATVVGHPNDKTAELLWIDNLNRDQPHEIPGLETQNSRRSSEYAAEPARPNEEQAPVSVEQQGRGRVSKVSHPKVAFGGNGSVTC